MPASIASLDRDFRPYARALLDALDEAGIQYVVTSTRRSSQTQTKLYNDYISGRSKYPAAPPGHSNHNKGMAIDIDIPDDRSLLSIVGEFWESFGPGFRWGGRFHDPVHFDYNG